MPQRLGPILLGPPLVKSWQLVHFLAVSWPAAESALASKGDTGSIAAGAAGAAGAAAVSLPALSPPWRSGFTSSWATKPVTIATKPATRMAPAILFISSDAMQKTPSKSPPNAHPGGGGM